ncbi:MAG: sortase family protein [Solirubrobacterales bacterium]|nr:sortase family protein [Solirubrobacterales bacterium]
MSPRIRSALRGLSTVLIVAGALLLADALTTLVWQEPISAFLAQQDQNRLAGDLTDLEKQAPTGLEQRALSTLEDPTQRIAFLARAERRKAKEGEAIGRIRIPKIGASFVVVDGTGTEDLKKGPGLYPQTSYPGVPGTTAIAGHRTTYGAPFRHIDDLRTDDEIFVDMPYARFTYQVEKQLIVDPTDVWVIHRVDHDRLVLSACNPLYSAAQRIIIFARLVKTEPRGAALSDRTLVEKPSGLPSSDR